jgi:hypothetical protein
MGAVGAEEAVPPARLPLIDGSGTDAVEHANVAVSIATKMLAAFLEFICPPRALYLPTDS